jgi:hypothetical protein
MPKILKKYGCIPVEQRAEEGMVAWRRGFWLDPEK